VQRAQVLVDLLVGRHGSTRAGGKVLLRQRCGDAWRSPSHGVFVPKNCGGKNLWRRCSPSRERYLRGVGAGHLNLRIMSPRAQ
jgi:hypothetical protein